MSTYIEVPIDSTNPVFQFPCVLGGSLFYLRFDWNVPDQVWQMSISDNQNNPIVFGMPLNEAEDTIGNYRALYPNLPTGILTLYDSTGQGAEAGRNDLGNRHLLIFMQDGT